MIKSDFEQMPKRYFYVLSIGKQNRIHSRSRVQRLRGMADKKARIKSIMRFTITNLSLSTGAEPLTNENGNQNEQRAFTIKAKIESWGTKWKW